METWTSRSNSAYTVTIDGGKVTASTWDVCPVGLGAGKARKALRACGFALPRKPRVQYDAWGRPIR